MKKSIQEDCQYCATRMDGLCEGKGDCSETDGYTPVRCDNCKEVYTSWVCPVCGSS